MNPLVSIIVPAYNTAEFIDECVKSILNQTYNNIEIIIIDDGSTDNTLSLVKSLYGSNELVSIFTKKNDGPSSAKNYGIKKANGDYITFVDSDDWIDPDMIKELVYKAIETNADFVVSPYRFWSKNLSKDTYINYRLLGSMSKYEQKVIYQNILINYSNPKSGIPYGGCGKLYNLRIIHKKLLFFDENLPLTEDVSFTISYLLVIDSANFIIQPKYNVRIRNNSTTTIYRDNQINFYKNITSEFLNLLSSKGLLNENNKDIVENNLIRLYIETIVFIIFYKNMNQKRKKKELIILFNDNQIRLMVLSKNSYSVFKFVEGVKNKYTYLVLRFSPTFLIISLLFLGNRLLNIFSLLKRKL